MLVLSDQAQYSGIQVAGCAYQLVPMPRIPPDYTNRMNVQLMWMNMSLEIGSAPFPPKHALKRTWSETTGIEEFFCALDQWHPSAFQSAFLLSSKRRWENPIHQVPQESPLFDGGFHGNLPSPPGLVKAKQKSMHCHWVFRFFHLRSNLDFGLEPGMEPSNNHMMPDRYSFCWTVYRPTFMSLGEVYDLLRPFHSRGTFSQSKWVRGHGHPRTHTGVDSYSARKGMVPISVVSQTL